MKKIKTLLMASTMILSMLSLSACGKEEPAPVTTPAPIQVSKEELGRVSESTTSAALEESVEPMTETTTAPVEEVIVGDKKLVPDCPVNVSADIPLGTFYVRSQTAKIYTLSEMTALDILNVTGNHQKSWEDLTTDTDFYFFGEPFSSLGIGIPEYYELLKDGEVFTKEERITEEDLQGLTIKGYGLSLQKSDVDEQIVYFYGNKIEGGDLYSNIALGSPRSVVEELLGEGFAGTNQEYPTVMYNNGETTMVIQYETVETILLDEAGNPILADTVYAIYLINNN